MNWISPDQMQAAGGHASRECLRIVASTIGGAVLFQLRAGDGSTHEFFMDRWCNIIDLEDRYPGEWTLTDAYAHAVPIISEKLNAVYSD